MTGRSGNGFGVSPFVWCRAIEHLVNPVPNAAGAIPNSPERIPSTAVEIRKRVLADATEFIDATGSHSFSKLVDHLAEDSVLEEAEAATGHGPVDTLIDILVEDGEFWVDYEEDVVVRSADVLEGLVLTHRLTTEEQQRGLLAAMPDLFTFIWDNLALDDGGGSIDLKYDWGEEPRYHPYGSLQGPPGWLDGFSPGDLLSFTYRSGGVRLEVVTEPGDGAAEQTAMAEVFEERVAAAPEVSFDVNILINKAIITDQGLFRSPVRPIGDLLDAAGIEVDEMWVGRKGEDWESGSIRSGVAVARMDAEKRGLADCCVSGIETVVGYALGREEDPGVVNAALSHGAVAPAFRDWWMERGDLAHPDFGELLQELIDRGRRDHAGARYLLALHHDSRDETVSAELQLEQAIVEDPAYGPGLWMLAGYASDRGELRRAISLWQRAGADPDEEPLRFHQNLETRFEGVGRNEPCPCGSGRKFKQCHLNQPVVSESNRISWMFEKLHRYILAHHRHDEIADLVFVAVGDELDEDEMVELWGDEFVADVAIFDDGLLDDFTAARSDLLPEEEQTLYRQWVGEPLRCWEVVATDRVNTVTLRDTASAETIELIDQSAATSVDEGEMILTRALPAFGRHWLSLAGMTVDLRRRDQVLSLLDDYPDAVTWIRWYHSLYASPIFTTTDGEEFVLASAKVRLLEGWDELDAFLDDRFERVEEDHWQDVRPAEDDLVNRWSGGP